MKRHRKYNPRKDTRYIKKCEYLKAKGFKQSSSGHLWLCEDKVLKDDIIKRADISVGAVQGMLSALAIGNKRKRKVKTIPYTPAPILENQPQDAMFYRVPGSFESGR